MAAAVALLSIIILAAAPKIVKPRSRVKFIILAAYLHVAWQMLPVINLPVVAAEILLDLLIWLLSTTSWKKRSLLYKTRSTSIGDIWKD